MEATDSSGESQANHKPIDLSSVKLGFLRMVSTSIGGLMRDVPGFISKTSIISPENAYGSTVHWKILLSFPVEHK